MKMNLEIPFTKYQAVGNDFIVVAAADVFAAMKHKVSEWSSSQPDDVGRATSIGVDLHAMAPSICDRHTGIGADGLLLMSRPQHGRNHGRMHVLNADGSVAEMSGNGIRCAAAYLVERGQPRSARRAKAAGKPSSRRTLRIETLAGVRSVDVVKAEGGRWVFRVSMGWPILEPEKIPFRGGGAAPPIVGFPLRNPNGIVQVTVTSMGNPHCSVLVDDFDTLDWPALGRTIESNELFPNRANVEFVKVLSKQEIEVRFWERGVGKTQSSGTGSCAAVVACILNGLTGRKVRVRTLAGDLEVAWPPKGEVTLTGSVELIARGTYYWRS